MEKGCLLNYDGDAFFKASLVKHLSCIIAAFHASYHNANGESKYEMGIVEGGNMAILVKTASMGLGAIDYTLHCSRRSGLLVVTDINEKVTLKTFIEALANIYLNSARTIAAKKAGKQPSKLEFMAQHLIMITEKMKLRLN